MDANEFATLLVRAGYYADFYSPSAAAAAADPASVAAREARGESSQLALRMFNAIAMARKAERPDSLAQARVTVARAVALRGGALAREYPVFAQNVVSYIEARYKGKTGSELPRSPPQQRTIDGQRFAAVLVDWLASDGQNMAVLRKLLFALEHTLVTQPGGEGYVLGAVNDHLSAVSSFARELFRAHADEAAEPREPAVLPVVADDKKPHLNRVARLLQQPNTRLAGLPADLLFMVSKHLLVTGPSSCNSLRGDTIQLEMSSHVDNVNGFTNTYMNDFAVDPHTGQLITLVGTRNAEGKDQVVVTFHQQVGVQPLHFLLDQSGSPTEDERKTARRLGYTLENERVMPQVLGYSSEAGLALVVVKQRVHYLGEALEATRFICFKTEGAREIVYSRTFHLNDIRARKVVLFADGTFALLYDRARRGTFFVSDREPRSFALRLYDAEATPGEPEGFFLTHASMAAQNNRLFVLTENMHFPSTRTAGLLQYKRRDGRLVQRGAAMSLNPSIAYIERSEIAVCGEHLIAVSLTRGVAMFTMDGGLVRTIALERGSSLLGPLSPAMQVHVDGATRLWILNKPLMDSPGVEYVDEQANASTIRAYT